jgi:hypothetical protein
VAVATGVAIVILTNFYTLFKMKLKSVLILVIIFVQAAAFLTAQENYRPELFFREDWKETPPETPVTQKHVDNPELLLQTYGAGKEGIKKSNHERPADDPFYIWSGTCPDNWLVSLKHRENNVDLTGFSKIRWRTKQAGLRELRIALKLADGTWLVSNLYSGPSKDWQINEFNLQDVTWHKLDIDSVVEVGPANNPDLSNVEEVGFTDLMPGGQSSACSRLDWIEVDGKPVKR